jgi:hypothetical protein
LRVRFITEKLMAISLHRCAMVIPSRVVRTGLAFRRSGGRMLRVEIRTALRAFYYNRAHGNTNALLIDMLGSKADANRSAPFEAIVASDTSPTDPHVSCMPDAPIDRAIIVLKGKWAHVARTMVSPDGKHRRR